MQTVIDGKAVRYIDEGQGDTVLLLHGWGAEAATYRLIIDHLSARFRVIAPDLPGFGGSEEPSEPWNVDDFADFTLRFLRAIDAQPTVAIGHSNGGRILIRLLSRKSGALAVGKAILLDSAGIKPRHGLGWYVRVYSYKAAKKAVNWKPVRTLAPSLVEKAKAHFGSADYRQASELMRQTMVRVVNEDLTDCLPAIAVPTLLIWGEADDATPLSDGRTMERLIPDAGLVVLPGAGHFAFAERWAQCRAVLDSFLS